MPQPINESQALDGFSETLAKRLLLQQQTVPVPNNLENGFPGLRALLQHPFPSEADAKNEFLRLLRNRINKVRGQPGQPPVPWDQVVRPVLNVLPALPTLPPAEPGKCRYEVDGQKFCVDDVTLVECNRLAGQHFPGELCP